MKYKYIVGLMVALNLGSVFSRETPEDTQVVFENTREIDNVKSYLNKRLPLQSIVYDMETLRQEAMLRNYRQKVIGLGAEDLQKEVEKDHEFYKSAMGVSFIYGWALNQSYEKEIITPFYVGKYFSFITLFEDLVARLKTDDNNIKIFLKSRFTLGLRAIEEDRFRFLFDGIIPLHYAIDQVRAADQKVDFVAAVNPGAATIPSVTTVPAPVPAVIPLVVPANPPVQKVVAPVMSPAGLTVSALDVKISATTPAGTSVVSASVKPVVAAPVAAGTSTNVNSAPVPTAPVATGTSTSMIVTPAATPSATPAVTLDPIVAKLSRELFYKTLRSSDRVHLEEIESKTGFAEHLWGMHRFDNYTPSAIAELNGYWLSGTFEGLQKYMIARPDLARNIPQEVKDVLLSLHAHVDRNYVFKGKALADHVQIVAQKINNQRNWDILNDDFMDATKLSSRNHHHFLKKLVKAHEGNFSDVILLGHFNVLKAMKDDITLDDLLSDPRIKQAAHAARLALLSHLDK